MLHEVLLVLAGTLVPFTQISLSIFSGWPDSFSTRGESHFDSDVSSPRARKYSHPIKDCVESSYGATKSLSTLSSNSNRLSGSVLLSYVSRTLRKVFLSESIENQ